MDENHSEKLLFEAFGDKSIYEILEIAKTASDEDIKRAYRKLALKHHPDKGGDAKMFQALSLAHSILSDPEKRKAYDETGDVEAEETSQDYAFWYEYFRGLFPKISVSDIEKFSDNYIGSEEEKSDIIAAYKEHGGDLKKIMETVMLAEDGDEHRICTVIDNAIQDGELKSCKKYASTRISEAVSEKRKQKKNAKSVGSAESLEQLILSKNQQRNSTTSAMNNIFEKYTKKRGSEDSSYDIPDDEFEALQKKITKTKKTRK